MYSIYINIKSTSSNYSLKNQESILIDTVDNLNQIGKWSRTCFYKETHRISLYLKLTRKNVNALKTFPLPPKFSDHFNSFSDQFDGLEKEFHEGVADQAQWSKLIIQWGTILNEASLLL